MLARIICKHPFLHRELAGILVIPDPLKPGVGGVKSVQPAYGADLLLSRALIMDDKN